MTTGIEIIQRFEKYCPLEMAETGDPVGLHIGTLNKPVKNVMITLDVRPEVVAEAIDKKVDLLIAKHPPIFRPIKRLTDDSPQTKMYLDLVKHDIAVYAAHTNIDIIENGLNDWFCEMLNVMNTEFITQTHTQTSKKVVVFVPLDYADSLRNALTKAGAGQIGTNYEGCSYSMEGTGRFTPIANAIPTIGALNQSEKVKEERIEMIFPAKLQSEIIKTIQENHPYEEPAFDIFSLDNYQKDYGIGRIGSLNQPVTLKNFIQKVKTVFQLDGLRVVGADLDKTIQKVAICGGSGEKFYQDALRKGADVYITGDVYYHTAHDMDSAGLTVIDPGHHIEVIFIEKLVEIFKNWQQIEDWQVNILPSETNTNPFKFY